MTTRIDGNHHRNTAASIQRADAQASPTAAGAPTTAASQEARQAVDPQRAADAREVQQAMTHLIHALMSGGVGGGGRSRRRRGKKARRGLRRGPKNLTAPNGTRIGGKRDVQTFLRVQDKLSTTQARPLAAGQAPPAGARALSFSPEEAARVRNAPTAEAAKQEVVKILAERTGQNLSGDYAGSRGKGPVGGPEREALNQLLGTRVKSGPEKNGTSAMIFDQMAGSIAQSLRSTSNPVAIQSTPATAELGPARAGRGDGIVIPGEEPPAARPPAAGEPVSVDVSDFVSPTETAGELLSPLIFDLQGQGLQIKKGERIAIDLDGDGKGEMITNLDNGLGLLVFEAIDSLDEDTDGAGRDYFGDQTDLAGYGIRSPRADGKWDNGFAALRALCESYELVHGDKQHLDARDLAFLEAEVGLRMRIEGLLGEDRTFAEVGISRINLGDPTKVQSIQEASTDRFGNKLMRQKGATFIVGERERPYADIWFSVTQRTRADKPAPGRSATTITPATR
jgi:hypothetical protein